MPSVEETTARERAQVATAVAKRQREFLTGRVAARRALARLGVPVLELEVGPRRAPQWPPEVVGSIAHSAEWCLVAVARRNLVGGLGLDVEPARPLAAELWPRICTPGEQEWIAAQPQAERGLWALRYFCAKEAVYKCQFPRSGRFLGFHEVEVRFGDRQVFHARAGTAAAALTGVLEAGSGRCCEMAESVFSAFSLPPSG